MELSSKKVPVFLMVTLEVEVPPAATPPNRDSWKFRAVGLLTMALRTDTRLSGTVSPAKRRLSSSPPRSRPMPRWFHLAVWVYRRVFSSGSADSVRPLPTLETTRSSSSPRGEPDSFLSPLAASVRASVPVGQLVTLGLRDSRMVSLLSALSSALGTRSRETSPRMMSAPLRSAERM